MRVIFFAAMLAFGGVANASEPTSHEQIETVV